jgi:hypothetical protein
MAGMGAAWIKFGRKNPLSYGVPPGMGADFVFFDYRQLRDYVLI